tara:strand:+ start:3729 stop:4394 length:666 start_codon:yes stop_codon:yes gene_type:complete
MTEQEPEKKPFEIKDPSERFKEIVADIPVDNSGGHDSGDEHKDVKADEDKTTEPVVSTPAPTPQPDSLMKSVDEYIDEDLASVVTKLVGEINALKSEKADRGASAKVDDLVTNLGEEWAPVFQDKANREKLKAAISILKVGYERSNVPVPDEQEIIQKALRSEFADLKTNIEREGIQSKIDDRKSQMISRASGRRSDSLSPKETAMRSVHKLMIDRGLYNS